jgi:hypothetical protein
MKTYEARVQVMVERIVYLEVEVDTEGVEEGSWDFDALIQEAVEEKYFNQPYDHFDYSEETAEITVENYNEESL